VGEGGGHVQEHVRSEALGRRHHPRLAFIHNFRQPPLDVIECNFSGSTSALKFDSLRGEAATSELHEGAEHNGEKVVTTGRWHRPGQTDTGAQPGLSDHTRGVTCQLTPRIPTGAFYGWQYLGFSSGQCRTGR
jgi:hypothetical protein